jgi:hypothetical protein
MAISFVEKEVHTTADDFSYVDSDVFAPASEAGADGEVHVTGYVT